MIPKVFAVYENASVQTDISATTEDTPFNTSNDASIFDDVENQLKESHLEYEPEMVEGVIQPLETDTDGTVINHHVPRLFKRRNALMIRNLFEQIEKNRANRDKYVREMAAALIPGLNDPKYHSVFTNSLYLPYRTVDAQILFNGSTEYEECQAIFSMDGTLTIQSDQKTLHCRIEIWERLVAGRSLKLIYEDKPFGTLILKDYVDPISFDGEKLPEQMIASLGLKSQDDICSLISADDTSFVDVMLCIPEITQKEANDLLAILYSKKLLSPYIRAKVCQFQIMEPKQQTVWPELLGRFIFLLDPNWTYQNIPLLRNNDVMAIFRHVKDMKSGALLVLRTAFTALEELRDADEILFFWTLLFMSIMKSATFANQKYAFKLENRILQIWKELQKKSKESNTRKMTEEVIESTKSIKKFKLDEKTHEEDEFLVMIISKYHESIFTILQANPYKKEESHPLFYPVVFQLETALVKAANNEDYITSESESMASEFGSYSSSGSYSRHSSRSGSRSAHSTHSSRRNAVPEINGNDQSDASYSSRHSHSSHHSSIKSGLDSESEHSSAQYSKHGSLPPSSVQRPSSKVPANSAAESEYSDASSKHSQSYHSSKSKSRTGENQTAPKPASNENEYDDDYSDSGYEQTPVKQSTNSKEYSKTTPSSKEYSSKHYSNASPKSKEYSSKQYSNASPKSKEYSSKQYSQASSKKNSVPPEDEYSDEFSDEKPVVNKKPTSEYSSGAYSAKKSSTKQSQPAAQDDGYYSYSDEEPAAPAPAPAKKSQPATASKSGTGTGTKSYSKTGDSEASYSSSRRQPPPPIKENGDSYDYSYSDDEPPKNSGTKGNSYEPSRKSTRATSTGTGIDSGTYSQKSSGNKIASVQSNKNDYDDDDYDYSYDDDN